MNTPLSLNRFLATGVGSLPHLDPQEACDLVFHYFKEDIPFWPQLPKRNFKENMYAQFAQGLPGLVIDEPAKKICINTDKDNYAQELEAAYEHYLGNDLDYFAVGKDYASGFYEFINRIKENISPAFIKGQIIGPLSFGLSVPDQNKKASIYNQEFCDCLIKVLGMKARWQVRKLREAIDEGRRTKDGGRGAGDEGRGTQKQTQIIIFIDEPYLVSIGSSFFNLKAQEVIRMLNDVAAAIHSQGAFAGIHCCGNTDWGVVLETDIDILNFDACNYLETIFLYRAQLDSFFKKNGLLAWGIVPTQTKEDLPTIDSLLKKMNISEELAQGIVRQKFSLVSPSCGLSGLSLEKAQEILALTVRLARSL